MIVSHKLKVIFIAIPKTGTHAVRFALRKHMDSSDIEQVQLFVKKKAPYREIAELPHGHITAREIRKAVGEETWNSYFKFACVRNPWDRFISYAFFMHRKTGLLRNNTLPVLKQIARDPAQNKKILFHPQHEFVTDEKGSLMVDYVCRMEELQSSYNKACELAGIPKETLEVVNKSEHLPYRDYYDGELKELVGNLYRKDADLFGYSF